MKPLKKHIKIMLAKNMVTFTIEGKNKVGVRLIDKLSFCELSFFKPQTFYAFFIDGMIFYVFVITKISRRPSAKKIFFDPLVQTFLHIFPNS